jgi:hypothetical protein
MKKLSRKRIIGISFITLLLVISLNFGLLTAGIFIIRHHVNKFPGTCMLSIIPIPKSIIQSQLNDDLWFVRLYTIMALNSSIIRPKNVVLPFLQDRLKHEGDKLCQFYLANAIVSYGDTVGVRKIYTDLMLNGFKRVAEAHQRLEKLDKK